MTVCEIVTHRIFVGLQHSHHLLRRPTLWQHWLEVLDGLGGFVDLVPGRGPGQHTSEPGEEQDAAAASLLWPMLLWPDLRLLTGPLLRKPANRVCNWRVCSAAACGVPAGWSVALSCPALGVKLTGQQPEQVLVSAELHRLSLQMPSTSHTSLTVQQVLVQASSSSRGASGSSRDAGMVPILQVPMTDQQASIIHTRFGAPEQTQRDPAAKPFAVSGAGFEAATSPKPSTLGRIYHESPLSSYISHVQVGCVASPDRLLPACLRCLHACQPVSPQHVHLISE